MKNMEELGFAEYCVTKDGAVYSLNSKGCKAKTCTPSYFKFI